CGQAVNAGLQMSRGFSICVVFLFSLLVTVVGPAAAVTPGTWRSAGAMSVGRVGHIAVLLPNDKVLVAAGNDGRNDCEHAMLLSAELFDPVTGLWSPAASMSTR